MPELWDICQGEVHTESRTSPGQQTAKLKSDVTFPITSTYIQEDCQINLLSFSLALVQYFLTMLSLLPLVMELYSLCYDMVDMYVIWF